MPNLTKIAPANPERIILGFDNGEEFTVSYLDLRFECPCASCVDEITGKRTLNRATLKADVKPMKIEPVGRYGVHIDWSDGHRTGMYHFDTLYSLASRKEN
jgi:DUF971 family protein